MVVRAVAALRGPGRRRPWRALVASLALLGVVLVGSGAAGAGAAPQANPLDCKSAPAPFSPSSGLRGMIAPRPDPLVPGDPWDDPNVPISSVYGYSWQWTTYDNGCGVGADWGPRMMGSVGNALFGMSGVLVATSHMSMREVADPSGWTGFLDQPVEEATIAVRDSVWGPWLLLALLLVAVLVLWRARNADAAGVISAAGWALVVLVVTTALMAYPVQASKGLDQLISSTVTASAGQYADAPVIYGPTGPEPPSATIAIDRQMDVITRDILWRQWVAGLLGTSDGPIADEFGPRFFRASHLTWAEDDLLKQDPEAAQSILDGKKVEWEKAADELKDRDPAAYDVMTGNQGRWGGAGTALFLALLCVPFLTAAALALVAAYLVIRLVIPLAPALGVVALLEPASSLVMAQLRRLAGFLVTGPILFVAALINLAFTSRIMASTAPPLLRYVMCFLVSALLWKLVRPHNLLAGVVGRARRPGSRTLDEAVGPRTSWLRRVPRESVVAAAVVAEGRAGPVAAGGPVAVGGPVAAGRPVAIGAPVAARAALAARAIPALQLPAGPAAEAPGLSVRQRREASGGLSAPRARLYRDAPDASGPVGAGPVGSGSGRGVPVPGVVHSRPYAGIQERSPLRLPPEEAVATSVGAILPRAAALPPIAPANVERRDGRDVWVIWTPAGESLTTLEPSTERDDDVA